MCRKADTEILGKKRHQVVPMQRPRVEPARPNLTIWEMKRSSQEGLRGWTQELLEHGRLIVLSLAFMTVAMYMDYYCGTYVSSTSGVKAPDLILDHFDPIDLSPLFVYGYAILIAVMFLYPLLFRVRMLHAVAFQFSLLLMVRSVAMLFTHLETPAGAVAVGFPWFFKGLYFENDMFFSGHTAMPFLGFYLFRENALRHVFLVGAIVMGIVALAMHLHYSIDVFSGFFITYCSYQAGNAILGKVRPTRRKQPVLTSPVKDAHICG
jgi:membrane-associated phospholipid phosphatase